MENNKPTPINTVSILDTLKQLYLNKEVIIYKGKTPYGKDIILCDKSNFPDIDFKEQVVLINDIVCNDEYEGAEFIFVYNNEDGKEKYFKLNPE